RGCIPVEEESGRVCARVGSEGGRDVQPGRSKRRGRTGFLRFVFFGCWSNGERRAGRLRGGEWVHGSICPISERAGESRRTARTDEIDQLGVVGEWGNECG